MIRRVDFLLHQRFDQFALELVDQIAVQQRLHFPLHQAQIHLFQQGNRLFFLRFAAADQCIKVELLMFGNDIDMRHAVGLAAAQRFQRVALHIRHRQFLRDDSQSVGEPAFLYHGFDIV